MSKSPIRDFSRLIDPVKTNKKESYYGNSTDLIQSSQKAVSQLKMKLDFALKHNTQLLDENSVLAEHNDKLLSELKRKQTQLQLYKKNTDNYIERNKKDKLILSQELQTKQKQYQNELQRLLAQITQLHDEKNALKTTKRRQIQHLKGYYERQAARRINESQQAYHYQSMNNKKQRDQFLLEIANSQVQKMNAISLQKAKLYKLNEQEIQNLINLNESHMAQLYSEINRLRQLMDIKTQQMKKLYEENDNIQRSFKEQNDLTKNENNQLKIRLKKLQEDNIEELQLFKIKMTKLFHTDIEALTKHYENQITNLSITNQQLQKTNRDLKDKLIKSISENDELRRNFEIQISKQKARVQDLKVKISALDAEHKQQITSLGTKVNLTSMTIIRQTGQKEKAMSFYDDEKKKFHSLANSKDKQIADLLASIQRIKKMHEDQIQVLRAEKNDFRNQLLESEKQKERIKQNYQKQIERKDEKLKENRHSNMKQLEQIKALSKRNQEVQTQNIKLQKQVEHVARDNRALAQQLGLKKGYIQTLHLQSSAAIEDQKSKIRVLMGANEISLKEYYEDKVRSKDKDIKSLQALLAEKQFDTRDLIVKYNALEKRLQTLLNTQNKLIQFQEKVKNIGLDNNLVKNLAELFKRYQKV